MNGAAPPCAIEMAIAGGGFPPAPPQLATFQQLPLMSTATSVPSQPLGMDNASVVLDIDGADGAPMAQISAPVPLPVTQRYEPYPGTQAPPPSGLVIFGLEDDEI